MRMKAVFARGFQHFTSLQQRLYFFWDHQLFPKPTDKTPICHTKGFKELFFKKTRSLNKMYNDRARENEL